MRINIKLKLTFLLALFLSMGFNSALANPSATSRVLQQVDQAMGEQKFKKLEDKLKQAIINNPTKGNYVALASLYMSENKNKQAIANYQEATLLDPTDSRLFTSMSVAYLHLSMYKMSKAMAEQALSIDSELKHAGKIIEYIDKKEEVLEKAAAAGKVKGFDK